MEAKLKEYRARRRRQELVEKTTEKLDNTKRHFVDLFKKMIKINIAEVQEDVVAPIFTKKPAKNSTSNEKQDLEEEYYEENSKNESTDKEEQRLIEMDSETSEVEPFIEKPPESWQHFIIKWSLYSVIWFTLFFYFISIQFGAVFFAISLLIGIYLNTGTRPKKKGEVSAYSVFNENCESIEGTVTAEKLQSQMFFGSFRLF